MTTDYHASAAVVLFLEFENGGGIHFGWRKVKKVEKICTRK